MSPVVGADERRARNVRTVEAFYESERRRDLSAWREFWHPQGRQTFPFAPAGTVSGIDELTTVTARKFEVRPPYGILTVVEPFADPERVLARLVIVPEGARGDEAGLTRIWCIFHFDDAGLVLEVEEMLDTASGAPMPQ